jgi:glutaredoxin
MDMRTKLLLLVLLAAMLLVPGGLTNSVQAQETTPEQVIIYIFWGEGCPYCHAELAFLDELSDRYPQIVVRDYEIYYNEEYRVYLRQMLAVHDLEPRGVPTTFINDRYWMGFSENIARQIEATVAACLQTTCADPGIGVVPIEIQQETAAAPEIAPDPFAPDETTITLPLIGEISLAGQSLWLSTALISFVDGFNPCSLWVLSILLALVIHSGSRRKTLLVGLTFLTVTSAVYGLFIAGLFSVFSFVGFIGWIQVAVALLALTFALINIKDYFWYKEGVSLTIADKHKPKIYRDIRGIMAGGKSTPALIGATAAMALGIALVELPCTAGFPVLWTNIVAAQEVPALTFALLLGLYMLIYLADELIVFGSVVLTLKASKFEEKQGRLLKLIGGTVMLALAVVLLIDPAIMNNIATSLLVFGAALLAALIVLVLHRRVLPQYGVYIGTEITAPDSPRRRRSSR